MLPFKLIYSDQYYLPIGQHVFPAEKYRRVHNKLIETGVADPSDFITPQPASDQDILLVHKPAYVNKLKTGTLSAIEELQLEIPYSPELVNAFWLAAGGSILAAENALKDGIAVNIGGVTEAANSTGAVANQVLASARSLTEQSGELRALVQTFLTEVKAA